MTKSTFIPQNDTRCIWMLAGVISYKLCRNNYNCHSCDFDRVMRNKSVHGKPVPAQSVPGASKVIHRKDINGLTVPDYYFYHPSHLWIRIEKSGKIRIGMDDFAQNVLGRISKIEFQQIDIIEKGEKFINVSGENIDTVFEIPFSGKIIENNNVLRTNPEIINHDPLNQGWITQIKPDRLTRALSNLLYGNEVVSWYRGELKKLTAQLTGKPDIPDATIDELLTNIKDGTPDENLKTFFTDK